MSANPIVVLAILGALISGAFAALQTPTNAMLSRAVNSPVNAALISFAVGTAALLVIALVMGVRPSPAAVRGLPAYAWAGGLYGAFFVTAAAFAAPRIGLGFFIALLVAGQMGMALLLDQLGAFGLERRPVDLSRLAGAGAILVGVLLIRR
ncbi:MAG TPA: DMT family transporter [Allosphingosinicella sp.]|nr:DMT family transporter [Allosphingosinicella sp.]